VYYGAAPLQTGAFDPTRIGEIEALKRVRLLTGPFRLTPSFIIVGGQRCGTTSLYNYLTQHPCIVPAIRKEIHFFDFHYSKGLSWYRAHFPTRSYACYVEHLRRGRVICGEASPYYLFHPAVPRRIFSLLPTVKLIVLLRNPVERAYSHYQHERRMGHEPLSFEEALDAEPVRLHGEKERLLVEENYQSFNYQHYSYTARGMYADQLQNWASAFPQNQLLILQSEKFLADTGACLKTIANFLGVPEWEPRDLRKYNQAEYPKMDASLRRRLLDHFESHNDRLYRLFSNSGAGDLNIRWH
jgi:hypothetical protein